MANLGLQLKVVRRLIDDIIDEHGFLSSVNIAVSRGRLLPDDGDDFLVGSSDYVEPLSLGDGPELEFDEDDDRIAGFEFMVEPVMRSSCVYGDPSIINNRHYPLIPPSVTAVPGQPNTYLDDEDADTVYRFMPINEHSDKGYVFVYYQNNLFAIIEGFNRCGGFAKKRKCDF